MGCGCGKGHGSQVHDATKVPKDALPAALRANPTGRIQSALPPAEEGRRDFARIFFANERKIFMAAPGMPSMRPLQPTAGPSSAHIGDLSSEVVEKAAILFCECVKEKLVQVSASEPDPALLDKLCTRAMAAMTVNVGVDFALHMQLLPTFLQPFFLVIVLGEPLEARVATYGFVAEKPHQVVGDRPESKRTPFCVRLLSPNLLSTEEVMMCWEVDYAVKEVRTTAIVQAVEEEMGRVRDATNAGRWDLLQPVLIE